MIIQWLKRLSVINATERESAEKIHSFYANKKSVPTMGGVLIVMGILISNLLWGDLTNRFLLILLVVVLWFGGVGFLDDYLKLKTASSKGLSGKVKLLGQLIAGIVLGLYLHFTPEFSKALYVPFFKQIMIPLGILFIPFVVEIGR